MKPFVLVLSSPSGGGKSTIARHLLEAREDLGYSVSATTRRPREGEVDGVHYYFVGREEFDRREAAGDFIETAEYAGERYGTLADELDRLARDGRHAILDIEVAGARQIRAARPDAVLVFILPPSGAVLVERLRGRGTEDRAAFRRRLDQAVAELASVAEYDYVIVNDDLVTAVDRVAAILDAESHRANRDDHLAERIEAIRHEIDPLET